MKKILVVNLAGLGDIVVSSPAVRALKARLKDGELYLLTFKDNIELVEMCPYFREVFIFDKNLSLWNFKEILKIRRLGFDWAVNLYPIYSFMGSLKMVFLFYLMAPKKSAGRDTGRKGFFYHLRLPESSRFPNHNLETMLGLVGLLGAEVSSKQPELWLRPDEDAVQKFLRRNGFSQNDRIVCIHPGAGNKLRRWPAENFSRFADNLIRKHGFKIVITGNEKEKGLAEYVVSLMEEKNSVGIAAGVFSLDALAACLKKSVLFITNETGPMHIASTLGVSTVIICGNTPTAFLPYRKEKTIILRKPFAGCSGGGFSRRDFDCLKSLSCEDVLSAAESLLNTA
ncbi:MAG TPA: glycosyltransferase family 9 protein [Candidatus Omnitrophota bacterium]|nr:glycosyltransferase family 9 protein [Candidatus Omnitrophota bacterium]HPD84321.1 glycosyltransferase family 9 protein [Candidatus Omnitrophota bacterium]HRZ03179.1 glycosyltransferase family 9 protein [Candidatus Omnitrophota bacterium]